MDALELSDCKHFAETHLHPALGAGLVEMALPANPTNKLDRQPLTALGYQKFSRRATISSLAWIPTT